MITRKILESLGFRFNHRAIKGGDNFNYTHKYLGKLMGHLEDGILNVNSPNREINLTFDNQFDLCEWLGN